MAEIMNKPNFRNIIITNYGSDNLSDTFVLYGGIEPIIELRIDRYHFSKINDLENSEEMRMYFISSLVNILNQIKTKKLVN